jgi:hypothetical protein
VFEDEEPRNATTRLFNWAFARLTVANVSCVVLESVEPIRATRSTSIENNVVGFVYSIRSSPPRLIEED